MLIFQLLARVFGASKLRMPTTFNIDIGQPMATPSIWSYLPSKRKVLFLVACVKQPWVKPEDQQENILCRDKCLVFPQVEHLYVNRDEISKGHIIPLPCLYCLAQSVKLKYSNKPGRSSQP